MRGENAGQRRHPEQALPLHIGLRLRPAALAADLNEGRGDPGERGLEDGGSLETLLEDAGDVEAVGHRPALLAQHAVRSRGDTRERVEHLGQVTAVAVDVVVGPAKQVLREPGGKPLGGAAGRIAGERPVEVLAVERVDEGHRCSKATGLDCRLATTVPRIRAGSRSRMNWRTATMGTYSPPWIPAVTARTGPGSVP